MTYGRSGLVGHNLILGYTIPLHTKSQQIIFRLYIILGGMATGYLGIFLTIHHGFDGTKVGVWVYSRGVAS